MRLVFLGTSAAQPTKRRGLSCVCLERDGEIIMFDAGEGAQMSYSRSGLGWNKKLKIFVTHMHGDHCVGILGLLQTMGMQNRTEAVEIYGPKGIEQFVSANIKMLNLNPPFPIGFTVIGQQDPVFENEEFSISACRASHSVTAFSYLFAEKDRPGRFDTACARRLGVPEGRLWGRLQHGHDVTVGGRVIRPGQVLGPSRPGKSIGISGDTIPTAELERFFAGCDYLVFDATFLEAKADRAAETRHSTARQAAELASSAGVGNLVLTHFSARYRDEDGHLNEARSIHGSVIAATDGLEVEIK